MNSITNLLPFCDNSNVCQLIVSVYAVMAMFVVMFFAVVVIGAVAWLYRVLADVKARDWVDLYYGFTDSKK